MSDVLLVALVAAAALACPVHRWWMHRRGRRPVCCSPKKQARAAPADAATLRARRADIEAQLNQFDVAAAPSGSEPTHTRVS